MYLVVPEDKRKTKVLPSFLIESVLEKSTKKVGQYSEGMLGKSKVWIKPHNP